MGDKKYRKALGFAGDRSTFTPHILSFTGVNPHTPCLRVFFLLVMRNHHTAWQLFFHDWMVAELEALLSASPTSTSPDVLWDLSRRQPTSTSSCHPSPRRARMPLCKSCTSLLQRASYWKPVTIKWDIDALAQS